MSRSVGVPALSGLVVILLFWFSQSAWSQTKGAAGLPNFGTVTATLFRGAQPSDAGFSSLKKMGVGIVVNFREERGETAREKSEVESLGMKYVGIPWSGHDDPTSAQVVQFLDLVRGNPQTKIFVHCQAGADRTGTMVAAYRILMQHKSLQDVVKEMHAYHYHHFFLPHLEQYVDSLPHLQTVDSLFSEYAPTPARVIQ
jgi:protein tyrosine/serine phosphatase